MNATCLTATERTRLLVKLVHRANPRVGEDTPINFAAICRGFGEAFTRETCKIVLAMIRSRN